MIYKKCINIFLLILFVNDVYLKHTLKLELNAKSVAIRCEKCVKITKLHILSNKMTFILHLGHSLNLFTIKSSLKSRKAI